MSQSADSSVQCSACGSAISPIHRRCPQCGAWIRPWSVGGKPSTWSRYKVGGGGRPEDWGAEMGNPTDAVSSVWVQTGKNGEYVRQSTPSGQPAPSGAHARKQRERVARERKRRSKS